MPSLQRAGGLQDRRASARCGDASTIDRRLCRAEQVRVRQIALVHDEDVGDLHDAGLHRLHVVAGAGRQRRRPSCPPSPPLRPRPARRRPSRPARRPCRRRRAPSRRPTSTAPARRGCRASPCCAETRPGSDVRSCMRMRSPSIAPWRERRRRIDGDDAERACRAARSSRASAPVSVLLPEPADPVRPTVCAVPERGYSCRQRAPARPACRSRSASAGARARGGCRRAAARPGLRRSALGYVARTGRVGGPVADELDDVFGRCARAEDRLEAQSSSAARCPRPG